MDPAEVERVEGRLRTIRDMRTEYSNRRKLQEQRDILESNVAVLITAMEAPELYNTTLAALETSMDETQMLLEEVDRELGTVPDIDDDYALALSLSQEPRTNAANRERDFANAPATYDADDILIANMTKKLEIYKQLVRRLNNWHPKLKVDLPSRNEIRDVLNTSFENDQNIVIMKKAFMAKPSLEVALAICVNYVFSLRHYDFQQWLAMAIEHCIEQVDPTYDKLAHTLYALLWSVVDTKFAATRTLKMVRSKNLHIFEHLTGPYFSRCQKAP